MHKISLLKQSVRMAVQNIKGNKMRSFLTTLGIIIGVTAVIALITTVSGVTNYMMDSFSSMGAGKLTLSITGTYLKQGLSTTDLSDIEALENVAGISPSVSVTTLVVSDGEVYDDISVTGKNATYFQHSDGVTRGRNLLPTDMSGGVYVCIVDDDAAKTLFPGKDPLNQKVKIGGISYTVVGVMDTGSDLMSSMSGGGRGGTICIPYENALIANGKSTVSSLEIYVKDTAYTDELVEEIEVLLDNAFNDADNAYTLINMDSLVEMMETMESMMTYLLAGIASIALLVGGIGIMNMMLVSVTERTKEIGLRKALGAEPGIIQIQFLAESVILSVMGGLIGIVLGEAISWLASILIGTTFRIEWYAVALGFGFALAIGMIFGWAPARNASRLNPIDALRSE